MGISRRRLLVELHQLAYVGTTILQFFEKLTS